MKNKRSIIIISIVVLIALLAGILSYLYLKTDIFKTNQQLFYKYLLSNEMMKDNGLNKASTLFERKKKYNNTENGNIQISYGTNNAANVADLQELFKINYQLNSNVQTKQSNGQLDLISNNQSIFKGSFIKDVNVYGIFLDKITNRYLSVENSNLKEFLKKLGAADVSDFPDSIPEIDIIELLKIDDETLNSLKTTYTTIIEQNIDKEHFSKSKSQDGSTVLLMTLTDSEILNIEQKLLETAKNDDILINLLVNKLNSVNYKLSSDTVKNKIQEIINKTANKETKNTEALKIELTVQNKTAKKYKITTITDNDSNLLEISFENNKMIMHLVTTNSNSSLQDDITYVIIKEDNGSNLVYTISANSQKNNLNYSFNVEINNYLSNNVGINLTQNINSDNFVANIKYNSNIMFSNNVKIENLTNDNSVKLNNMTQEQINGILTALVQRFNQVYGNQIETAIAGFKMSGLKQITEE